MKIAQYVERGPRQSKIYIQVKGIEWVDQFVGLGRELTPTNDSSEDI